MGDVLGGAGLGIVGQVMQNQANVSMVNQQEAYQTQMSDTAYQRQVADMKIAGLNPMFAIGSGGASAPAGSVAQQGNVATAGLQGAAQAQQMKQTEQAISNAATQQQNQNQTTKADVLLKGAQTLQATATAKNQNIDSKEKDAIANVADGVNAVTDKVKQGYKMLWNMFDSNASKQAPIQYGTPSVTKP